MTGASDTDKIKFSKSHNTHTYTYYIIYTVIVNSLRIDTKNRKKADKNMIILNLHINAQQKVNNINRKIDTNNTLN